MGKILAFVFMTCVVSATSHIINRTLWPATRACQVYHYDKWEDYMNEYDVQSVGDTLKFEFDSTQLDREFILNHDKNHDGSPNGGTNFYFNFYKRKEGSDSLDTESLTALTPEERPKLFVKKDDGTKVEYYMSLVELTLPGEIYDNDNHSPDYVSIDYHFASTVPNEKPLAVETVIYGAEEEGIVADAVIAKFLNSLTEDKVAKSHPLVRDLNLAKPAMESLTTTQVPVYLMGDMDLIALASCEYTDKNVFRPLYDRYHFRPRGL